MNCKKCGRELPKNCVFCPDCGEPVPLNENNGVNNAVVETEKVKLSLWETFKISIGNCYKDFTKGRASRKEFWSTVLFTFLLFLAVEALVIVFSTIIVALGQDSLSSGTIISFIIFYILLMPLFVIAFFLGLTLMRLTFKRMHDVGQPWGVALIPIYNIVMLFIPGTKGPNKYGEKPEN